MCHWLRAALYELLFIIFTPEPTTDLCSQQAGVIYYKEPPSYAYCSPILHPTSTPTCIFQTSNAFNLILLHHYSLLPTHCIRRNTVPVHPTTSCSNQTYCLPIHPTGFLCILMGWQYQGQGKQIKECQYLSTFPQQVINWCCLFIMLYSCYEIAFQKRTWYKIMFCYELQYWWIFSK